MQQGSNGGVSLRREADGALTLGTDIPQALLWGHGREQLLTDLVLVAELTGIPQLANLASMDLPKPSIRLVTIMGRSPSRQAGQRSRSRMPTVFSSLLGFDPIIGLASVAPAKAIRT